jgi:hypothetical protein
MTDCGFAGRSPEDIQMISRCSRPTHNQPRQLGWICSCSNVDPEITLDQNPSLFPVPEPISLFFRNNSLIFCVGNLAVNL